MKKVKLVLDTNILIYALNEDSLYFDAVRTMLSDNRYSFFITTKSISEFVSVLSKLDRYDIIENELTDIINSYSLLFPNKRSISIFKALIGKYQPVGNRVFDFEIASIMLSRKIDLLFTFNTNDFKDIDEITLFDLDSIST